MGAGMWIGALGGYLVGAWAAGRGGARLAAGAAGASFGAFLGYLLDQQRSSGALPAPPNVPVLADCPPAGPKLPLPGRWTRRPTHTLGPGPSVPAPRNWPDVSPDGRG